ncbi:MAG: tripartite tricarboxylate transporter permease [Fusobacterium sp. JB019]|nr:tripartite tricarboxylate transporter permease [Fusobacterium sp. JB019]
MEHILLGFSSVLNPTNLLVLTFGVMLGMLVGALPGLNDTITMAVLIPITFGMAPHVALCLLVGVYTASCYGGSIPAILLKIPGTAASLVTTLDGYPMTERGEANQALGISISSSVFGGIFSSLILLFFAPILANQALKFGPPEYFMLGVLGISSVLGMATKDIMKNIISLFVGLFISLVGISAQTGTTRFTFGNYNLFSGVPFVPALIGLFGVVSLLNILENIGMKQEQIKKPGKIGSVLISKKMAKKLLPTWITSSLIGSGCGVLPGAGFIMAVFMSYDLTMKRLKNKVFGTGIDEGIAAPESANNSVVASSMVPLLSLGIPGNSSSALFLGALTIQGVKAGPALFTDYPGVAFHIMVSFLVANIIMFPLGVIFCRHFAGIILNLPKDILAVVVTILCVTGSYAILNSVFAIYLTIFFGILGYLFNKISLPLSPLILCMILGSMMEKNFIQALTISNYNFKIFLSSGISIGLFLLSMLFIMMPIIKNIKKRK